MASEAEDQDMMFARMAVDHKLVSEANIRKAYKQTQLLRQQGREVTLGEVLRQLNFLSEPQYEAVIRACTYRIQRREDKVLGKVIIEARYAQQSKVVAALKQQKASYQQSGETASLADLLLKEGECNQYQLIAARKIRSLVGEVT